MKMNRDEAFFTLGLADTADREEIEAAYTRQTAELDVRIKGAPTEPLRAKYQSALADLDAARAALLPPRSAPPPNAPGISATRSLPGAAILIAVLGLVLVLGGGILFRAQLETGPGETQSGDEDRKQALELEREVEARREKLEAKSHALESEVRSTRQEPERPFPHRELDEVDRRAYASDAQARMEREVRSSEAQSEAENVAKAFAASRDSSEEAQPHRRKLSASADAGEVEAAKDAQVEETGIAPLAAEGSRLEAIETHPSATELDSSAESEERTNIADPKVADEKKPRRGERRWLAVELERLAAERLRRIKFVEMITVPTGDFWYGCNERVDSECDGREKPGGKTVLDAYAVDRTEVTVDAYAACVEAGVCKPPGTGPACNWGPSVKGDHPVNCVDWNQSKKYCEWQGKRLPSEEEWEKAARGEYGRKYPWGNESVTCDHAQIRGCSKGTVAAGRKSMGESPYGVLDMVGNVREWTSNEHPRIHSYRMIRGGAWYDTAESARASSRDGGNLRRGDIGIGFRCASDEYVGLPPAHLGEQSRLSGNARMR
jgi:iron(II)-dependent oxidoreductase